MNVTTRFSRGVYGMISSQADMGHLCRTFYRNKQKIKCSFKHSIFHKIDTTKSGAVGYMFHYESVNHVFLMLKFSPFPIILLRIFWLNIVKISKF